MTSPISCFLVEFRGGAVYCYFEVPLTIHQGLLAAPSQGAYFNRFIRAQFSFTRLTTTNHGISPTTPD
jgi:hypothetical protein